jgi:hypothetical protein
MAVRFSTRQLGPGLEATFPAPRPPTGSQSTAATQSVGRAAVGLRLLFTKQSDIYGAEVAYRWAIDSGDPDFIQR